MAANLVPYLPADALKQLKQLAAWIEPCANLALNKACNNSSGIRNHKNPPKQADCDKVLPASKEPQLSIRVKRNPTPEAACLLVDLT